MTATSAVDTFSHSPEASRPLNPEAYPGSTLPRLSVAYPVHAVIRARAAAISEALLAPERTDPAA